MSEVIEKLQRAKAACAKLALLSATQRKSALRQSAQALRDNCAEIIAANAADVAAARAKDTAEPLVDRLLLTTERIAKMASALEQVADQPEVLGEVVSGRSLYNGIALRQIRVPLGVVAIIYEARPNVTADAAGLCLKTGNTLVLRGGSLAIHSNLCLSRILHDAGVEAGLPAGWLQSIETTERSAANELMGAHGLVDLLIPRGSAGLIRSVVEQAQVPVIETGAGNCHIYVHRAADPDLVIPIVLNAKTQRPGVCNACESLLVDRAVADRFVPPLLDALTAAGVRVHLDPTYKPAEAWSGLATADGSPLVCPADDDDWGREYLGLEISLKLVDGLDQAIAHINHYSTHHSEAILSRDYTACQAFFAGVDSACVYANASTRFSDGGEFGLGAEIGISTQKLHARGPMGAAALTSTKYLLEGDGQIRD
ncbi:MAG: glutamate-5-semialdehyde dehydrogenase [Coriobacteriales bacterium]|jgi:glutamate-5-semialdehyde dehydrogenase|nr:glutamate-5-semialdehyde dehydrogenase [Coriobacteriales bacterium]